MKHSGYSTENKVSLLMDNHESHISVDSLRKAKENGIVMLMFPPHCGHKMQSLDVSIYFPFKDYYHSQCASWMVFNPGQTLSIYNIAALASQAFELAFTPKNILSSFSATGIYPLNRDVFTEIELMSSAKPATPPQSSSSDEEEESELGRCSEDISDVGCFGLKLLRMSRLSKWETSFWSSFTRRLQLCIMWVW
ncbi:unnamed protein product [Acanthoscelides obtectus]|uniref:DDE-1 domain-containing protein n=1 Tax=Acanthoscelides obtectus TaxID=200917 RepID=A0A9P0LUR9_ACAOB|nr:unnamed protein product [Acanthoscelides obtectus]CAK1619921.1 hypothetical protein AOBTE_LOCUS77 [Acanthoscelides obtectus]